MKYPTKRPDLLKVSPYEIDGGKLILIGRDPRAMSASGP